MGPSASPVTRAGLLAIFVLSGFAGLIYQSIWSRYLGLFLGHAAYAQALVLAIFMGGMAAGAAWIARAGERWRNLVRGYAVIEAVIGVLALAFHSVYVGATGLAYDVLIPAAGSPALADLLRWGLAALLILPQTILLGMTFPLMSGGLIRRFPGQEGGLLGGLYFTNSIGAAFGALVAVFVLLPWVGLRGAMVAAGLLNLVVAALAWWLARDPEPQPQAAAAHEAPREVTPGDAADDTPLRGQALLRTVLIGTALSGAASFVYEIVWIRMLSLAVGSTMHAFELMLAAFIAGIALGGLWVRKRADRSPVPLRLVGWMQICMGVAALASLAVYSQAFEWVGWLMQALDRTAAGYQLFNLGTATIAVLIMLPAAFFAGTTLPLFTVALLRDGQGERSIGRVYAWNTMGSIAGVFAAIHLLIPGLGVKLALCVAALVDLGIGLYLLRSRGQDTKGLVRFAVAAAIAGVSLVLAVTQVNFDPVRLASGVFRTGRAALSDDNKVAYYRDGKTASVSVITTPREGLVSIATNGKVDASIQMDDRQPPASDEATMALLAAYPLAALARPAEVGVIGFGSGMTTHVLLGDARVKRVDTIEIEPAVVAGARAFGRRVERAFVDPRSNIVIDDAKAFFVGQQQRYDAIVSEPSNPWISGVGALFSSEFYRFIPRHLKDDGVFVQWVQLYEFDDRLLASILKALTPAFADYSAWLANDTDLIIVASPKGPLPAMDFARVLQGPVGAELRRRGLDHPGLLAFRQVADGAVLRALAALHAGVPVNSDYFPVLGLHAPQARFMGGAAQHLVSYPVQPLLMLEALGLRPAPPPDAQPSPASAFGAEYQLQHARNMLAYLMPASPAHVGSVFRDGVQPAIQLKASAAQSCGQPLVPQQVATVATHLVTFARHVIHFVPPEGLRGVFDRPAWVACHAAWPADLQRLLGLLDRMGQRDWAAMAEQARQWLQSPTELVQSHPDVRALAMTALMLGEAQQRRWPAVLAAEQALGPSIPVLQSAPGDLTIRQVLVHIAAGKQLAPAVGAGPQARP